MNLYKNNTKSPVTLVIYSAMIFGFSVIAVNDIQADNISNKNTTNQTKIESKTKVVIPAEKVTTKSNQTTEPVRSQPTEPKRKPVIIHHPDGSKSIQMDDSRWIPLNVEIRGNGKLTTSH